MDGFVVSIVTVSESELELPARSLTEQDTECVRAAVTSKVQGPVPVREAGELSTVQDGAPSNPEPESDEVTVSVTGAVTFQPLEPSAVWETVMAGFVVSIFTVSESELWLPARSWTEQSTECEPSPETLNVHGPDPASAPAGELSTVHEGDPSSPEPEPSDAVTCSVTGEETFHPFEPSAVCETAMVGGAVSTVQAKDAGADWFATSSTAS